jgi:adenylate cyclase, class 2
MHYEVEMKFPAPDAADLERRLAEFGATLSAEKAETDVYFAHPARDYAQTDEALRLRRKGDEFFITYKGPKIDSTTKTRQEIEIPLATDEPGFQAWFALLGSLGFRAAGQVKKRRRKAQIPWQGRMVEGSLDEVEQVGAYFEIELIADAEGLDAARASLRTLANALRLPAGERRSYLELVLEAQGR